MWTCQALCQQRQSLSAERVPFAQRGGLSCIPHLAVSQQARPRTAFPHHGGRQKATCCMRDRDHPRGCEFSLPLWTVCLSFLSHLCSPAARAQGNKEDALSPWAKSWVSANWSLLMLSQYNSVARKCPFPHLLYYFERCAMSFGLLKVKT